MNPVEALTAFVLVAVSCYVLGLGTRELIEWNEKRDRAKWQELRAKNVIRSDRWGS